MEQINRPEILADSEIAKNMYGALKDLFESVSDTSYNEVFLATLWLFAGAISINAQKHEQPIETELDETMDCLAQRVFAVHQLNQEKTNERAT